MPTRVVASLIAGLLLAPAAGSAQDCPLGRVSYIFVDNHSIFDLAEMDEDARFRWAYELANAVHMDTRKDFLRDELLFAEGECYDRFLLAETERILRNYPFIARADVFGVTQPDGSRHVVVDTQDEWTTKLDLGVAFDEGLRLEGIELTEENLFGRGILAGFFFRERRERRDAGVLFGTPRLLGTRLDARFSAGTTRVGSFVDQGFFYPFVGEVGRVGGRQVYRSRESIFPYSVPGDREISHVLLPFQEEALEFTVAGRLGRPGNLTVFGAGVLREELTFDGFPGDVELAQEGDFSDTRPAGAEEAEAVEAHVSGISIFRINFLFGQRNIRFVQRRGLDALDGIQDVRLGSAVDVTLGRSLGDLGGGGLATPDDLYTRLRVFAGVAPGSWILSTNANVEARHVFDEGGTGEGWRDILAEIDGYFYWQPGQSQRHTVFGRVSGAGGWSVARPFQLTLGGRRGVRGYSEPDFPGARRVVLTLEDRIRLGWPAPDLFDLGFTVFADAGRMWAGEVPFGETVGWKAALGAGIRFGFPSGTRGVVRADLALPVTRPGRFADPIFRVSIRETVGLLPGFDDEEIRRSRRPAVGTDLLTESSR